MSGDVYVQYFVMITLCSICYILKTVVINTVLWKDDMKCVIFFTSPSIPSTREPPCGCGDPFTPIYCLDAPPIHPCQTGVTFSVHEAVPKECGVYMVLQMPVYTCDNIIVYPSWMLNGKIALFKKKIKIKKKVHVH